MPFGARYFGSRKKHTKRTREKEIQTQLWVHIGTHPSKRLSNDVAFPLTLWSILLYFNKRYLESLNMREERQKRGESNHSSTKEDTLICIRAGLASVTYNTAGFHITHRDCYNALSTIHPQTSSTFSSSILLLLPLFLYYIVVQCKSQSLAPNHATVLRLFILPILSSSPSSSHFFWCCPPSTLLSVLVASPLF